MNNLKKQHLIRRQNLDESAYFQSILQEAYRLNLLSAAEYENIQVQSLQLLVKQVQRYTGGESSSVKVETAQNIMQAIFYVLSICLKGFSEPDIGIAILKQKPLSELYQHGKMLIAEQLESAKQLLAQIQNDGFITDNQAYNDTIWEGVPPFFSAYDVDFAAHAIPASIDYPLGHDKMDRNGLEYVLNYLQTLYSENKFLNFFPLSAIHRLLGSFSNDYKDLLVNIFELVLTNALGCILVNKNFILLNIEPAERKYLKEKLLNSSKDELNRILHEALNPLCKELDIADPFLQKHLTEILPDLSARITNALAKNSLESIFISFKENPRQPILFQEGTKMDDELFRSIIDEIKGCRSVSAKISIIQQEIHSLSDLLDILGCYCIFGDEFPALFGSLGDMELALLIKTLPPENILATDIHYSENEKEWQDQLKSYYTQLALPRQQRIKKLVEKLSMTL